MKPMLYHKFDFSLCYFRDHLFVMGGKNSAKKVVKTCEKYSVKTNRWMKMKDAKIERFAASACGLEENSCVYLFGGRSNKDDEMVKDIEEYNIETDTWKRIFKLKNFNQWVPVEVLCSVQVDKNKILIFGGCDKEVNDSKRSYILDMEKKELVRKKDMKKAHVFLYSPLLYGNHIYVLGNEYY